MSHTKMTTITNNLTFAQKATLGNASQTVCQPINWPQILKQPDSFTPQTVRTYLIDVIEKLSQHFAVHMDGSLMGKIRVTRRSTNGANPVHVDISTWRAQQLFPQMVQCAWEERGQKKTLFKNVVDLFLKSRNRRELYQCQPQNQPVRTSPVIKWLRTQLSLPTECCPINWGGLNARNLLYESFLESVDSRAGWNPKSISQEFYRALPNCRPETGLRIRRCGVAMMHMPTRDFCCDVLNNWIQKNEIANTLRF